MLPMSQLINKNPLAVLFGPGGSETGEVFYVVHPLDDEPEEKRNPEALGPLKLSRGERFVLIALRGYILAMMGLAVYRMVDLAGLLQHIPH